MALRTVSVLLLVALLVPTSSAWWWSRRRRRPSVPASCSALPSLSQGKVSWTGLGHGSKATYTCYTNYKIVGVSQRTCSNGVWSGSTPKCVVACSYPSRPTYGNVYVHGTSAYYSCYYGYKLVGNSVRYCRGYSWSGGAPRCMRVCPTLPNPPNGKVIVSGNTARYTCYYGYRLQGNSVRTCNYGVWGGTQPTCVRVCPTLSSPTNGLVSVVSNKATYTCNYGYRLQGSSTRTCYNGVWSGTRPSCIRVCPTLYSPSNGLVRVSGDRATYTCKYGYTLQGNSIRTCRYGVWSGKQPSCARACPTLNSPSNGLVRVSGDRATYTCKYGYTLQGNSIRTCRYGVWSGKQPSCARACPTLSSPSNGLVIVSGNRATYTCNYGYRLHGNSIRTCYNSVWGGTQPSCIPSSCPILNSPPNGLVTVSGRTATYTCNPSYTLQGNSIRTCYYAAWNGSQPSCVADCPELESPSNGLVEVSGNTATYSCNTGYILEGVTTRKCSKGAWSERAPVCLEDCVDGTQWRDSCNQMCSCVKDQVRCCRERKDIESMTEQEKRLYVDTVITASTDPSYRSQYETLLQIHRTQFQSGIHEIDQFLPWHRWFLLEYENLLRSVNCNVTVPYWDWSLWARQPFSSPIWGNEDHHIGGNGAGAQQCVQDGRFREGEWSLPDGSCLSRRFTPAAVFPGPADVSIVMNFVPSDFRKFEGGLRLNLHDQVHCLIGGTMCNVGAAYAPEFFLHHGFIDKLWAEWQGKSPDHHDAHFSTMTSPMTGAGSTSASDVIDNSNLPDAVSVCYTDSTDSDLTSVVIATSLLSTSNLHKLSRPVFLPMSSTSFDLFNVSASDRALAVQIDKSIRIGTQNPPPAGKNFHAMVIDPQAQVQKARLGFSMANVKAASA